MFKFNNRLNCVLVILDRFYQISFILLGERAFNPVDYVNIHLGAAIQECVCVSALCVGPRNYRAVCWHRRGRRSAGRGM